METRKLKILPHQRDAARWVVRTRAGNLWAGMGTGKTIITLLALELMARRKVAGLRRKVGDDPKAPPPVMYGFKRALIVTKPRLATCTWPDEMNTDKWPFLKTIRLDVLAGTPEQRIEILNKAAARNQIHTISFELVPWLVDHCTQKGERLFDWPYPIVICDESTRLGGFRKRNGSKQPAVLNKIRSQVTRWFNLTGTPTPNSYIVLWGQQWFIDFGAALGSSFMEFVDKFFYRHPQLQYPTKLRPGAAETIAELLAPTTYIIRAEDHMDIEEPVIDVRKFDLPVNHQRLHNALLKGCSGVKVSDITLPSGAQLVPPNQAVCVQKANQVCSGAVYLDKSVYDTGGIRYEELHDEKIKLLEEYLEELDGSTTLIAYSYVSDRERILKHPSLTRFGIRDINEGKNVLEDWNNGKVPALLLHPASAGHGLNLQFGGHHIVFFSIDWNAETHFQTIGRIGPTRQIASGYDRCVFVTYLLARNSVEDKVIYPVLYSKQDQQEALKTYIGSL